MHLHVRIGSALSSQKKSLRICLLSAAHDKARHIEIETCDSCTLRRIILAGGGACILHGGVAGRGRKAQEPGHFLPQLPKAIC